VVSISLKGGSVPVCAGTLVAETHVLTSLECARMLTDGEGVMATARIGNSTFMVHPCDRP